MRKQAKKCVGLLLALSLVLSCVQIAPVLAEVSAAEESSVETTKTWDFEDAGQIDDFDLGKFEPSNTNSANWTKEYMEITGGYLYAKNESSTDGQFKKTILKETDLAVKSVSVDFYPENYSSSYPSESTSDVMKGGIYVGYADEVTKTGFWRTDDCVFVYLADYDTNTTNLTLNVDRGTSAASIPLINGTNINSSNQLYNTKYPQPLKLTVEIAGSYLLVTVSLLDDETKCFEQIIDLRKDKDTKETGYTSDILLGRVGLGSHGWGAKFDNFTVELDTNMDARTWDFNKSGQVNDFELDKIYNASASANVQTAEHFKIENGYFCASNEGTYEGRFKKAILKDTELPVKSVSVDIQPTSGKTILGGGIYLGLPDTLTQNGSWRVDDCVFVNLKDEGASDTKIQLEIYRGIDGTGGNILLYQDTTINSDGSIHSSNSAQPMRMKVDIVGPYALVTVSLLSNDTKYFTAVADVRVKKDGTTATGFTSDALVGRVGVGAWCEGALFDNFTINGDTFTVGGINDSQIAVSKYGTFPTGADIVDGKYILGWSQNGVDMGATATYKKVADTYEANVVDPAMLGLHRQTAPSATKTGCYDVRFIGSLNEFFNSDTNTYENYKRAGFVFTLDSSYATADKLIVDDENCVTKTTYNLYSGLNQTVNGSTTTQSPAAEYESDYAKYFFAYEITGVSIAEGKSSRTIYARAYLELENGDIVYGEPSSVTVGDTSKQMDVYLIAGQSNAAGRSAFTTASLEEKNSAYVNGFSNVLYSGAAYNKTAGNLVTLQSVKAGFGAPDDNGKIIDTMGPEVGMADAFSTYYNETSGNTAGIVKLGACAVSLVNDVTSGKNSSLGNWVSPSYEACLKKQGTLTDEKITGGMYAMFVEQVIASLQQIREAGYEPNIKGIYWMQGENDRGKEQEYVQAFRYFATDIRNDLSTWAGQDLSNMPIVIGEISRTFNSATEQTRNETFIAMQNTLPDFVSNCYVADISDYDVNEMQNDVSVVIGTDRGHYNEADCLAIGKLVGSLMMEKAGVLAE